MSNSHRSRRSNTGHRSRRRHSRGHYTGEPNGLQPGDDVGNRRSMKQAILPPDDLGNRKEPIESSSLLPDDSGNRIDLPPTHEVSGILAELDGRRRRKKKGTGTLMRIGRYFVGGVNPLVSGIQPPVKPVTMPTEMVPNGEASDELDEEGLDDDELGRRKRRRRRRRDGRDQIDGAAAQEVSHRRAQRFFDFEEDDRFEYVLKSDAQSKCDAAREAVHSVLMYAQRDAVVEARVIEDRDRPKVVVTIDEKGSAASLTLEQRSENADQAIFVLGNGALMALNYLVNKVVNRYPDDRIRLAILPKADEPLYLESLAQHLKAQEEKQQGEVAAEQAVDAEAKEAQALNGKTLPNGVGESDAVIEVAPAETPEAAAVDAESNVSADSFDSAEVEVSETPEQAEAPKKKTRARTTKSTGTAKTAAPKTRTSSAHKTKAAAADDDSETAESADLARESDDEESAAPVKKAPKKTAKKATKKVAKKTTKKVAKKSTAASADTADAEDAETKPKKTTKKSAAGASKKVSTSRKTKATKTSAKDEAEDT